MIFTADVEAILIPRPPNRLIQLMSAAAVLLKVINGWVWLGPAVISMPALDADAVVSTVKMALLVPPPSSTTKAFAAFFDMRTKLSNCALASTSKSPEMRRSLLAEMKFECVVTAEPSLLYETLAADPLAKLKAPDAVRSPAWETANLLMPLAWSLMSCPPPVSLIQIDGSESASASAELGERETPDPPALSSSPQKKRLVVISHPNAWVSPSQSTMGTPVELSVSIYAEAEAILKEAVPMTERSPEMRTSLA